MMIDIERERTRSLKQLTDLWPPRYRNRATHVTTLSNYVRKGHRGIKLEAVRVGGQWISSIEAMSRFLEALSGLDASPGAMPQSAHPPTPSARRRSAERAERDLAAAGF